MSNDLASTSSLDFAAFLQNLGYEFSESPSIADGKYFLQFDMSRNKMDDEYRNFVMSPFYRYSSLQKNLRRTLGKAK